MKTPLGCISNYGLSARSKQITAAPEYHPTPFCPMPFFDVHLVAAEPFRGVHL